MASAIPEGAYLKDISATYNEHTLARSLRTLSPLAPEMWARVVVFSGEVDLILEGQREPVHCTPQAPGIIPVDTAFRMAATGKPVRFHLEYYHEPRLHDATELASLLASGAKGRRAAQG